jgi:serine phosphatase RsbU (regulator of sigma subunit)
MEVWGGNSAVCRQVEVAGLDAWVCCEPFEGDAAGGDLHYVSTCGSGRVSRFVVADVSGHGMRVGELADRLRGLMRKHVNVLNMARFAQELNRELAAMEENGRFATAVLATYFAPSDHLVVCNAGHPRPMLYRAAANTWELLDKDMPARASHVEGAVNLPLGIIEPTPYYQFATRLAPGDVVVLYTDSLLEARSAGDEELGEERLLDLARGIDPTRSDRFGGRLLEAIAEFRGGARPNDDQTVLVLRHNATDPPPMTRGWAALTRVARAVGAIDY